MHLAHPSLSLSGKKKGKVKFKSSADAQRARQLEADWQQLLNSHGVSQEDKKRKRALAAEPLVYSLSTPVGRTNTKHIPSRDSGHMGAVSSKPIPQYTGTKIIGIGTMHKSNAVPIFSDDEAVEISRMRR